MIARFFLSCRRLIPAAAGCALAFGLSCQGFARIDLRDCKTVADMPGPEDFEIDRADAKKPRLLVSAQDRRKRDPNGEAMLAGQIFSLPLDAGTPEPLILKNRDELPFHPHGISLIRQGNESTLYVINHVMSVNHVIEVFTLKEKELIFKTRLRHPLLVHPNDLVALPDGELYVTNDHGKTGVAGFIEDLFAAGWSNVVHLKKGSWEIVAEGIAFANGVQVNSKGDRLFVSGTRDRGIHVYPRETATGKIGAQVDFWNLNSGLDNLLWEDEYHLVTAGHPDVVAFLGHVRSAESHSPSEIFRVEAVTGQFERIMANDGRLIDAASTALIFNGRLYMSQVFDPEIVHCSFVR